MSVLHIGANKRNEVDLSMSTLFSLPSSPQGRLFVVVAYVEALTWTGLLVGMVLKHVTETTARGVEIFGPIHGLAFMVYAVVTIMAAVALGWPWKVLAVALLAAVPPLATIPAERWIARNGYLESSRGQAAASSAHKVS